MLRIALLVFILIHGFIHLFGFLKAFHFASLNQLQQSVGKVQGLLWLVCCLIFILSALQYFNLKEYWWLFLMIAVSLSQFLIFSFWQDAKFGSISNILLVLVSLFGFFSWKYENEY